MLEFISLIFLSYLVFSIRFNFNAEGFIELSFGKFCSFEFNVPYCLELDYFF